MNVKQLGINGSVPCRNKVIITFESQCEDKYIVHKWHPYSCAVIQAQI